MVPLIGGLDKIEPYLTPASPGSSPPVSAGMNQRPKDLLVGKDEGDLRGPAFASSSAPFYYMEAEPNARPQGLDKLHPHSAMRGSGKSASTPPSPPQQGAVKKATFDGQQRVPSGGVWVQGNAGDEMTDEDGASVLAIGLALLTWLVLSLLVVSSFVRAEKRRETLLRLWRAVHEHPQLKHVVEQVSQGGHKNTHTGGHKRKAVALDPWKENCGNKYDQARIQARDIAQFLVPSSDSAPPV